MGQDVGRSRGEAGQALILFTVMIVVFLGFCALVVDVGRAYAERRSMQNAADASTLAATKLVSDSLMPCTDATTRNVCSGVTWAQVTQLARTQVDANASLLSGYQNASNLGNYTAPIDMTVRYAVYPIGGSQCSTTWNTIANLSDKVPGIVCKIRVDVASHWTTWFPIPDSAGGVAQQPGTAGAHATGMIVGDNSLEARADIWPMTRRRSVMSPLMQVPDVNSPTPFWNSQACQKQTDNCGPSWKEQLNLALNSNRSPWSTPSEPRSQPLESSRLFLSNPRQDDAWRGGQWFGLSLPNLSSQGGGTWDTRANEPTTTSNFTQVNSQVDLGNWFAYGFGGKISLTNDWSNSATMQCINWLYPGDAIPCGIPDPTTLQSSAYNLNVNNNNSTDKNYLTTSQSWWRPTGDWIETNNGDLGNNLAQPIADYLSKYATPGCPFSYQWGNCAVIAVYMWEGGQVWVQDTTTGLWSWQPWVSPSQSPDRVHLVDFAYFAFYQDLPASSSLVQGFFVAGSEAGFPTTFNVPPSNRLNHYFLVGG